MTAVDASATVPPVPPAPPAPPTAAPAARFIGDRGEYWRLLIRGNALLAVTLGIYRFWLATDVRRYLWSNTEISGETLEYTGTPTELLIGFLIALAVLVPLYLAFALAAFTLGPVGQFVSSLSFPLLLFLGQFAVYRARRYRLTRTIYRGVRCHQGGSAVRYAICAVFWGILVVISLGLAYPFAQSRLERFKMGNTWYGDLNGRFEGLGLGLFIRGLPMWLMTIGPMVFAAAYAATAVEWNRFIAAAKRAGSAQEFINQLETSFPTVYTAIVIAIVAVSVSVVMATVLYPVFQAMVLRWWLSGLRFGALTVQSRLRTGQIYGAYLRLLWYGFLFSLAMGVAGGGIFGSVNGMLTAVKVSQVADIVRALTGLGIYVATMLGFSVIYQATVKLAFWRCGVETAEIERLDVLDQVKAEGAPSSAVGEGLADALNVGGI
jgi:uncharacterized membrane protein YjgN (DUF898 family)